MIKFNVDKLRAVYVYIVKVTTDYVYVTTHRNGELFAPKGSQFTTYGKNNVTKIKLHRSVSNGFFKYNVMKEFGTPRLATLNYYGGNIISIEIQMYNHRVGGFQEAANWKSNFSKVAQAVESQVENLDDVWINGQEIFWLDNESEHNHFSLSTDDTLAIHKVKYIKLARIGLSISQKENTKKEIESGNTEDGGLLDDIDNSAKLIISEGKVMVYSPNAAHPDQEQIAVYSPVLQGDSFGKTKFSGKETEQSEETLAYMINSPVNPCYPSIEFVLRAAKTIGKLYGHKETEFLNIPAIIASTGEVNFYNIEASSRSGTPIDMKAMDALAWLFGFIYRETKLDNMRELSTMFRFIINKGLVFQSNIESPFRDDAPSNSVPLLNTEFLYKGLVNDRVFFQNHTDIELRNVSEK